MVRQLIDYLPPFLRDVREYKEIMSRGEQEEISVLWEAADGVLADQFVNTATLNGVKRWESILGIKPKGTDSLDDRKFRILSRLNEQLPYTLLVLRNMLQALCGGGGFSAEVQAETYTLTVKVALVAKSNIDDVGNLLRKVVPANMVIFLELKYNTWALVKSFTWRDIGAKTWGEIKEEVIT